MSGSTKGRTIMLWVLAVVVTLVALTFQRRVGPTRPVNGRATVGANSIKYRLERTCGDRGDFRFAVKAPAPTFGYVEFRRFPTNDAWSRRDLTRENESLVGMLPHQPPGGKVAYRVFLQADSASSPVALPVDEPIAVRFRGFVPGWVLGPHIVLMFLGMLWANRAGLEAIAGGRGLKRQSRIALALLVWGGLVLGPAVQWYAFGKAWTGVPFGWDLTDNKTLIAVIAWAAAFLIGLRGRSAGTYSNPRPTQAARLWVIGAAIVTVLVFSIPHSVLGTQLDYSKLPASTTTGATGGGATGTD